MGRRGSSPLARGLLRYLRLRRGEVGIIPRSRGVYVCVASGLTRPSGSSPLARGLRRSSIVIEHGPGIIPARAGFTCSGHSRSSESWDHPRSRGVYEVSMKPPPPDDGSSPLARGLLSGSTHAAQASRIIPARAGFTPPRPTTRSVSGDHPRSRGVYTLRGVGALRSHGSSPLARGLRSHRQPASPPAGIIPARAGFTVA